MSDSNQSKLDEKLYWMLDQPFFIDEPQLNAFYDAVIQPKVKADEEFELVLGDETAKKVSSSVGAELDIASIAGSLGKILTPLNVTASHERGWTRSTQQTGKRTLTFKPIETPHRQLIQLTSQYLVNFPERIAFVNDLTCDRTWAHSETIERMPRQLVFLDLPGVDTARKNDLQETKLIPMAVEFDNGEITTLYDKLGVERAGDSWEEYIDNFDPHKAVEVIENETTGRGKIEWINYRIPLSGDRTFRVHFESNGSYNNGTFAYNLVKLGHQHGLRIIGTVQQEPDVRVLAGYRK